MPTSPIQDNPSGSGAPGLKSGRRVLSQPTLRKGDEPFREGDESRELFVVKEGCLQVAQGQGEPRVELAEVAKQGLEGDMSLLDGMPRSATVRAASDSVVTVIGLVEAGHVKCCPVRDGQGWTLPGSVEFREPIAADLVKLQELLSDCPASPGAV